MLNVGYLYFNTECGAKNLQLASCAAETTAL